MEKKEIDAELNRKALNIAKAAESQPTLDVSPEYPELNLGDPKPVWTEPVPIPRGKGATPCSSPQVPNSPGALGLTIPHPIITKRTRTNSTYERAKDNPVERGMIKYFSRTKGHGFIVNEQKSDEEIFVHVSDIEGELVPRAGDEVTYKLCPIPPKLEKFQAIHVQIINYTPDVHLSWDSPVKEEEKAE